MGERARGRQDKEEREGEDASLRVTRARIEPLAAATTRECFWVGASSGRVLRAGS